MAVHLPRPPDRADGLALTGFNATWLALLRHPMRLCAADLCPSQATKHPHWHDAHILYIEYGWERRILKAGGSSLDEENDHAFFVVTLATNMDQQSFRSFGAVCGVLWGLIPQLAMSQMVNFLKTKWNYKGNVIEIPITDRFFPSAMKWASEQKQLNSLDNLVATSNEEVWFPTSRRIYEADTSFRRVVFVPNYGRYHFVHDGHPMQFERLPNQGGQGQAVERIEFSVRGKDMQFLKDFVQKIYSSYHNKDGKVMVYQARVVEKAAQWTEARPTSRDIDTVVFDQEILKDAERFFSDDTKTYYQRNGQSYHRGYLFYGPPGTGKSSLSEAIATRFRLPIYQISLDSKEITGSHLHALFGDLPDQCVLLLEDVRVAGAFVRDKSSTYSSLLNLLDGVGAPEGRLLIMTTNDQDRSQFDKPLTRPGRVDCVYEFGNADAACLRQLFLSLVDSQSEVEIGELAEAFAERVPKERFSPAAITGFLLNHRKPGEALANVDSWIASALGSINSGEKSLKADDSEPQPVLKD